MNTNMNINIFINKFFDYNLIVLFLIVYVYLCYDDDDIYVLLYAK